MAKYRPKVISICKMPGQSFGFYLRVEHGEDGHLIRCLEMGGPAELAGMRNGDRILRVNGTFVDEMAHSEVVDMVRMNGASVTFHILDEASYKQAKADGVDLSNHQTTAVAKDVVQNAPKPQLCYLEKSNSSYGFALQSGYGPPGIFVKEVSPGGIAHKAGVKANDRLVEINGENIEGCSHNQVVDKVNTAGNRIVFLLVDEEADEYYKNKKIKACFATIKYLPHKPRIIELTKGSEGFGFLLRAYSTEGHTIGDIEKGSPADRAGLKKMDRLVAVGGKDVDGYTHEEVVNRIWKSGNTCSFLVVDKDTDEMYKLAQVSPMLFYESMIEANSPPSYTEALKLPTPVQLSKSHQEKTEELKPKLCRMKKTSDSYGFHLNAIEGVSGFFINEVVKGGAADRAGLEDYDIVVEVNGQNVESSSYKNVVETIKCSSDSLEMLVATKSVYDQLTAKGVTITRLLLGETANALVHSAEFSEEERHEDDSKPETPSETSRERSSSSSSESSLDERL